MYDIFWYYTKNPTIILQKTRNTAKTSANRIYLSRQATGRRIFVI